MPTHKSEDYKLSAVEYYLTEDKTQEEVCKVFKCLNNTKLCNFTGESYLDSVCYKEFCKYLETIKYTGQIHTTYAHSHRSCRKIYENGVHRTIFVIDNDGRLYFLKICYRNEIK
jgi:hypothetical protein